MTMPWRTALSATAAFAAAVLAVPGAASAQASGQTDFQGRCSICHAVVAGQRSGAGPNLHGVVGRRAAASDYPLYSPALKAYGKVWTPALLDQWLTAPAKLVPGTRMVAMVPDAKERARIIAYLQTLR